MLRPVALALALMLAMPAVGQQETPAQPAMACAALPLVAQWLSMRGAVVINLMHIPNTRYGGVLIYKLGTKVFAAPMSSPACVLSMAMEVGEFVAEAGA